MRAAADRNEQASVSQQVGVRPLLVGMTAPGVHDASLQIHELNEGQVAARDQRVAGAERSATYCEITSSPSSTVSSVKPT